MEAEEEEGFRSKKSEIEIEIKNHTYLVTTRKFPNRRRYYNRKPFPPIIDTVSQDEIPSKKYSLIRYKSSPDSVINEYYYSKKNSGWRHQKIESKQYIKFISKKKFGVITEFGVIQAQYDSICGMAAESGKQPYFIVGKRESKKSPMLFGVIDATGKVLIPLTNKSLTTYMVMSNNRQYEPYTHGFITTNFNIKQSYYDQNGKLILDNYDVIQPYNLPQYRLIIKKDNLYGFYTNRDFLRPTFADLPLGARYFYEYKVVVLHDENKKFKGYGTRSGKVFYED
jgi:hypothetical protein